MQVLAQLCGFLWTLHIGAVCSDGQNCLSEKVGNKWSVTDHWGGERGLEEKLGELP